MKGEGNSGFICRAAGQRLSLTLLSVKLMAKAKPRKKKVAEPSKAARNRALRRAPEDFRLLVDNLNEPGLQLPQAKKNC